MTDESTVGSSETEERDAGSTHSSAQDLGDITAHRLPDPGGPRQSVGFDGDAVDYYRFELSESRELRIMLSALTGEAEFYLEDAGGNVLARSMTFAGHEAVIRTLSAGTYYLQVVPVGTQGSNYELKYMVLQAHASSAWSGGVLERMEPPQFEADGYRFEVMEELDGSATGVLLGVVRATDPSGEPLSYAIVGGNESGAFAIDEASGEVFYVGTGEDFESGADPYELTVRVGDGTHTVDTTVTVTVTDAPEAPGFGASSYAFALAENADGSETGIPLGTVSATDPEGESLSYSIAGGNDSGLFAIDGSSGEVFYVGTGEDYESGAGPYELTVRVGDGTHTVDATVTVTVTVTDAPEAPAFAASSYAFALAENADGSETGIPLGTVSATDPEGESLSYSIAGGNDSGLFAIDGSSGEVFYVGTGEDFESGAGPHELTVRAGDGARTVDATVTVAVTDVEDDPEPVDQDQPADRTTEAVVLVDGGPVRGAIGSASDWDWFAVDLQGGRTYRVDHRGSSTGDGTLVDPVLMGVLEYSTGRRQLAGTSDNDGGTGHNGRAEFVAPHDGRYYIWLAGNGTERYGTGTYELEVREVPAPVFGRSSYAFALAENADGSEKGASCSARCRRRTPKATPCATASRAATRTRRFAIDRDER